MTVAAEINHVSYIGDGSIFEFAFTFKIFAAEDLKVVITAIDETDYTLPNTIGPDDVTFSVTGEAGKFETGGTVELLYDAGSSMLPWTLPSGWTITISLNLSLTQPTDLVYGGKYSSEAIETMADRTVKMIQQLTEAVCSISGGGSGDGGSSSVTMGEWGVPTSVTISGGEITVPKCGYYSVDTEAQAATDDLTKIVGLSSGDQIILKPESSLRTVVVKQSNYLFLNTGMDFTMNHIYDRIVLQCAGSNVCVELGGRTSGGY